MKILIPLTRGKIEDLPNQYNTTLVNAIKELYPEQVKVCIITDSNVAPLYLEQLKSAVSDVLNSMEGRGIITKEADVCDARRKRIIISKKAIETHDVMMKRLDSLNDSILDGISEDELNIFYKVIEKLKENMKKEGV